MAEIAVRCTGLSKSFGGVRAVDSLSLALEEGAFLALLGPSGCGKTTTLRLIAGFETPDSGSIEIAGRTVVGEGAWVPPERRRVGMVFQDYALFPHLSVSENVGFGLANDGGRPARVAEVLTMVGLAGLEARMPRELSGGQQQRVALARALAPRPELVLLDEPFSNLDASLRARVRGEVREILREAGATVIFVTHDQEEALSLADHVAVMWAGRIVQVASPEDVYRSPTTQQVAAFVGDANFLPGFVDDGTVRCELGTLLAPGNIQGDVELMFRPETLVPVPDEEGPGVVMDREYYGHDAMLTVRLESGTRLRSRISLHESERVPTLKQRVKLQVQGVPVVYPQKSPRSAERSAI